MLCNAGNHIVVFLSVIQLFFRVHLERVVPMRFVCPALLLEKVSCCSNPIACGDDTDAPKKKNTFSYKLGSTIIQPKESMILIPNFL